MSVLASRDFTPTKKLPPEGFEHWTLDPVIMRSIRIESNLFLLPTLDTNIDVGNFVFAKNSRMQVLPKFAPHGVDLDDGL